jgi:hypothetical protein
MELEPVLAARVGDGLAAGVAHHHGALCWSTVGRENAPGQHDARGAFRQLALSSFCDARNQEGAENDLAGPAGERTRHDVDLQSDSCEQRRSRIKSANSESRIVRAPLRYVNGETT